jgi:hypothetical protein
VENKYKSMLLDGSYLKQAKTDNSRIIAMAAEIQSLQAQAHMSTAVKAASAPTRQDDRPKRRPDGRPHLIGADAWRLQPPKTGEEQVKTAKGKQWYYCAYHGYWCCHPTDDINEGGTTIKGCRDKDTKPVFNHPDAPKDSAATLPTVMAQVAMLEGDTVEGDDN